MAYTRRGFKAGAKATTLNGGVASGATSVVGSDLSTWSGLTTNGPGTGTINRGLPDEDIFTFTGISTNTLTGVSGLDLDHASGATLEHTSSSVDFDEANAHIADTTLDHHTQYLKTNGSRVATGALQSTVSVIAGAGATGAAAPFVKGYDDGTRARVEAGHGTLANCDLDLAAKGSGSVRLNPGSGGNLVILNAITATTVGAAGGGSALPATPIGYWTVQLGAGASVKIPYYNT